MRYLIFKYIRSFLISLLWIVLILAIAACIYIFYFPEFTFYTIRIVNPFYDFIQSMPGWIYVVMYFIVFAIMSVITFIALSGIYDLKRRRSSEIKERYTKFFISSLTHLFFTEHYSNEENKQELLKKLTAQLKDRLQVLSFFDAYTKIQESITIDKSAQFKELVTKLKLERKLEALIYHKRFDDKILAMRVLSHLGIRSCDKQIFRNAQSHNFALRTEAYAALVRLMQKDEYLVDYIGEKDELSLLDINTIVSAVLKNQKMQIKYNALLASQNQKKVIIGQLLAKSRVEMDSRNLTPIMAHIGHENTIMNKLAWEALVTLVPQKEAMEVLFERFEDEKDEIKLHILEKSKHLTDNAYLNFLTRVMEKQTLLVKLKAMRIIFDNDFDLISQFINSDNSDTIMAYNETSNMFING